MEANYDMLGEMPNLEHYELSRAEKKRDREKQRRKDLNEAYDKLSAVLFKIDPKIREEAEERSIAHRSNDRGAVEDVLTLNRLDLINSAVEVMQRLYEENEERKMVIIHLSRGLLAGSKSGGSLPPELLPPPPPPHLPVAPPFPNPRDIQRQIELDAFIARGGATGMPPLRNDPYRILREQAAMELGMGAASLPVPPLNPSDSSLFRRNPISASSIGMNPLHQVYPDGRLSRDGEQDGMGSPAEYRARLDRIMREEEECALAGLTGLGNMPGRIPPALLSHPRNPVGAPPVRVAEIRQALMREKALAAAATAGRSPQGIFPKTEPKAKRSRKRN